MKCSDIAKTHKIAQSDVILKVLTKTCPTPLNTVLVIKVLTLATVAKRINFAKICNCEWVRLTVPSIEGKKSLW